MVHVDFLSEIFWTITGVFGLPLTGDFDETLVGGLVSSTNRI